MRGVLTKFIADDSGATAIEYGLIAALLGVTLIAALKSVGNNVSNTFTAVSGNMTK